MENEKFTWSETNTETLKSLWAEGLSASQIAGRIGGGVTRNAVIGKVDRLNLQSRDRAPRKAAPRTARKPWEPSVPGRSAGGTSLKTYEPSVPRPMPLPEPKPMRLIDNAKDGRITILHLSDKTCKWPLGDPQHKDFCFCGHGPREGSSYCEYHARIAYVPPRAPKVERT